MMNFLQRPTYLLWKNRHWAVKEALSTVVRPWKHIDLAHPKIIIMAECLMFLLTVGRNHVLLWINNHTVEDQRKTIEVMAEILQWDPETKQKVLI